MRRMLMVSVLFALAVIAVTAAGQEPGSSVYRERVVVESDFPFPFQYTRAQPPKTEDDKGDKKTEKKAEKKADPTDAAIAAALANDPDVRVAKVKMQLAEAELAKARQAVTLKVLTLKAAIEQHRVAVTGAQERAAWAARMVEKGLMQQNQLLAEREKLETAKAALALAEAEWKMLTGSAFGTAPAAGGGTATANAETLAQAMKWLAAQNRDPDATATALQALMAAYGERQTVKGPIPDRIRAALDKPVKLAPKGEKVTFEKALEVFKRDAGLDVPVRGTFPVRSFVDPKNPNEFQNRPIEIVSEGEELPVGAWFQLFEDNAVFVQRGGATRFQFYVRDYGLLVTSADTAPPDAPTLTNFWKQKPPPEKK